MSIIEIKNSLTTKIILMAALILLLLIPLSMVQNMVEERETRRDEAVNEVSSKWGQAQDLIGPLLIIPYKVYYLDDNKIRRVKISNATFLPESLRIAGRVAPEKRSRGLYEVILYRVEDLRFSGTFKKPDFHEFHIDPENIMWDDAFLSVGIPDTRGIRREINLKWNTAVIPFKPGVRDSAVYASGIHVMTGNPVRGDDKEINFSFSLDLQGSSSLFFSPLGKKTVVELESAWAHPSFSGSCLPSKRDINSGGFKAAWNISYFGRNFPQQWTGATAPSNESIAAASFGVELFQPVDFYQKCVRATKYGLLFISLTFLTFFLFEIFMKLSIHPLQYLLIGFAMSIFYLLFLSLSEYMNFVVSYLLSSAGVIAMISGYGITVLKDKRRGGIIALILTGLYGYLFLLLENRDYTLLLGSTVLFAALGIVMYITRNIDWYSVQLKKRAEDSAAE